MGDTLDVVGCFDRDIGSIKVRNRGASEVEVHEPTKQGAAARHVVVTAETGGFTRFRF